MEAVPETFGIGKSSISRKFVEASSKQLKEFLERDLSEQDIIAIIMDGKTFAEEEIITALGVTLSGQKLILGFKDSLKPLKRSLARKLSCNAVNGISAKMSWPIYRKPIRMPFVRNSSRLISSPLMSVPDAN